MPIDPDAIAAAARAWLGVPWRHQGRTRQGVDCAGLVVLVGRDLGLADYDTSAYGRRPEGQGFVQHFRAAMDGISLPEAGLGDVLVFADAAYPCHCGFLTMKHRVPHLLHAHALRRKVIEEPYTGEWPLKVKLAFRFGRLGVMGEQAEYQPCSDGSNIARIEGVSQAVAEQVEAKDREKDGDTWK